jgi:SAM-dependent methyltransferase
MKGRDQSARGGRILSRSIAVAVLMAGLAAIPTRAAQTTLAPFVATPSDVVDRMLRLASVGPRDMVYDLGSGDGRIVIAAAKTFGARGVGLDIDPVLVEQAAANARAAGVADRVSFRLQDAMTADVSDATVVTLYLLAASNVKLRPRLQAQLRPGSRIVAHNFGMGDWEPEKVDTFVDAAGSTRTLMLWRIR